jgi:hypothetical protein
VWTGCTGELRDSALGCSCECVPNDGGATVWVLSVWVPTASRNSACARRDKARYDCKARERARRRRQRHLQSDRLGSMTGSQATAGLRGGAMRDSGHLTNSEPIRLGPASARRPGPHQGEGFSAHLALQTRRRGGGDEQRGTAWSRGSRAARSMASTSTSPLCSSPAPWRPGEAANSSVKRRQAVRLGDGAT